MSADCNSNIERMNLRALVFLCILLLCMKDIEGAVSKYDPNSTDEADDPEPDKDTFEYPPLTCDEPIEIKGPAGAALVCPDHKSVLPETHPELLERADHFPVKIKNIHYYFRDVPGFQILR